MDTYQLLSVALNKSDRPEIGSQLLVWNLVPEQFAELRGSSEAHVCFIIPQRKRNRQVKPFHLQTPLATGETHAVLTSKCVRHTSDANSESITDSVAVNSIPITKNTCCGCGPNYSE